ncbi:MAG: hypothetical protein Q7S34_01450 [bacterium]|nr:hypothetical protein [bacterium]
MSVFPFSPMINPHNPIDPSDPPPEGWENVRDSDCRCPLSPNKYVEWQSRELFRKSRQGTVSAE